MSFNRLSNNDNKVILTDNLSTFYNCCYFLQNHIRERKLLPAKLALNYAVHAVVHDVVVSVLIWDRAIRPKTKLNSIVGQIGQS